MKLPGHGTGLALVAAASYQSDEIRVQTCSSCSASLSALGIVLIVVLVAVVSTSISVVLIYTSLITNNVEQLFILFAIWDMTVSFCPFNKLGGFIFFFLLSCSNSLIF